MKTYIIAVIIGPLCLVTNVYSICNVYSGPEGELDCRSFTWIGMSIRLHNFILKRIFFNSNNLGSDLCHILYPIAG